MDRTRRFYDELAQDYDLIFADWNASVRRQGSVIARLIGKPFDTRVNRIGARWR